jgi:hypothetical protein
MRDAVAGAGAVYFNAHHPDIWDSAMSAAVDVQRLRAIKRCEVRARTAEAGQ